MMKIDRTINNSRAITENNVKGPAVVQKENIRAISDLMKSVRNQNLQFGKGAFLPRKSYDLSHSHF